MAIPHKVPTIFSVVTMNLYLCSSWNAHGANSDKLGLAVHSQLSNVAMGNHRHGEFKFPYKVAVRKRHAIEQEVGRTGFPRLHWKQSHVFDGFTSVFVGIQLHYPLPLLPLLRTHLHSKENRRKSFISLSLSHTYTQSLQRCNQSSKGIE